MAPRRTFTHLARSGRPRMVDVGKKRVTRRTAHAVAVVRLPPALARRLVAGDIDSPKGPVLQAAVLAGIAGAKRTWELIPLCHPIPLDGCDLEAVVGPAGPDGSVDVSLHCRARTQARTGVEMEALTGASVAALALYDMGKSVSRGIVISEVRLLEKTGGKRDYRAPR